MGGNHRMKNAEYAYVSPFKDSTGNMHFTGAYHFHYGNRNLLIGGNGNIILMDDELYTQFDGKDLDEEMWFKLLQRGLAVHREREENLTADQEEIFLPSFFMIDMTNNCNIGCKYCLRESADSVNSKVLSEEMAESIVDYIINYCKRHNLTKVNIQPWGGEPLLEKKKIFLIQDRLQKNGIDVDIDIETNGTLLTEEVVRELYERKIGYGISLDGYADLNDRQRVYLNGKGTYEKVTDAVRLTKKYYGENISVLATVTKQTLNHVGVIIEHFAKVLKLRKIKMNFVHQSGFKEEKDYCVNEKDIETGVNAIIDKIVELNECGIDIMEYNLWLKMLNILTNREKDICLSRGCSGGKDMITFDTRGNIYPCDVTDFPEERLGSIYDGIDLSELVHKAVGEKDYFKEKKSEKCVDCPWKHFCNGGCTVRVKCSGGECGSIDKNECAANRVIYPRIIQLILEKPDLVNRMVGFNIL